VLLVASFAQLHLTHLATHLHCQSTYFYLFPAVIGSRTFNSAFLLMSCAFAPTSVDLGVFSRTSHALMGKNQTTPLT